MSLYILLEATCPVRNLRRSYMLSIEQDLFGVWLVEAKYGRIGAQGRILKTVVQDEEAAKRLARAILKRRARARARIGTPYIVRQAIGSFRSSLDDFELSPGRSLENLSSRAGG